MPILTPYALPASPQHLAPLLQSPSVSTTPSTPTLLLLFLASDDPATNAPWCSDVRAALPVLNRLFGSEAGPEVRCVYVGGKEEWRKMDNVFRTVWGVDAVPSLVRYGAREGRVVEVGRMKEGELLDEKRVKGFTEG